MYREATPLVVAGGGGGASSNGVGAGATLHAKLIVRPRPQVKISSPSAVEGNTGSKYLRFVVSIGRNSTVPVTVEWSTVDGTAVAGTDYEAASGTATIIPGTRWAAFSIRINGERLVEADETFQVSLSSPVAATIATGTGTGTIRNND